MSLLCRHCASVLDVEFLDLGHMAPSNAYLTPDMMRMPEMTYPLRLRTCMHCGLVQTEDYARADALFTPEYAYFSSMSRSWLAHAARYCELVTARYKLNASSFVVELASNDGYLLKNFVAAGIPCLGIEPTDSTAEHAEAQGIPVLREFFGENLGRRLANEGKTADLVAANNVMAHVPDVNDFAAGMAAILKPEGVITVEFHHLMQLVENLQFDTVYHEHFSYLSLGAITHIFARAGLRVFDVEALPTHGGSLRVHACRKEAAHQENARVAAMIQAEEAAGLLDEATYTGFQEKIEAIKDGLLRFLLEQKTKGARIAGYGAAAKGNTLLNFAGIRRDMLPYICDAAPSKIGKYMPGSHIPIVSPDVLAQEQPDVVLVLPWNIAAEIKDQLSGVVGPKTQFVAAVPELRTL